MTRPFVPDDTPSVSDERLEELRAHYESLAAQPVRKERGYSDKEHVKIIEELQDARRALAMYAIRDRNK